MKINTNNSKHLAELKKLTTLLDSSIKLPGGFRVGLDGFIGLIPGIGDAVSSLISSYIIYKAYRLGASFSTLIVMTANLLLDFIVGSIPFIGDIFDFLYKANSKNLLILEEHLQEPTTTIKRNRISAAIIIMSLIIIVLIPIWFVVIIINALLAAI